jgi:hypothetical protein
MKKLRGNPGVFMISYAAAYAFAFFMDWPMFRYYPLHGNFNWGRQIQSGMGPAITWYGLLADAVLFAIIVSITVADRAISGLIKSYAWIVPAGAMILSVYLLRNFLF